MEIWKTVKSAPNYQVSNLGSVKNCITGKILKISTNNYGYKLVCLSNNGKKQTSYIHRLIAEAFIDTDLDTTVNIVNHKDGNKTNNSINNLEWASYKQNLYHSRSRLKIGINQLDDLVDLLSQMSQDQITSVIAYCKNVVR